ncbi:hypothetical protein QBC35DRAFT_462050 [Podospora australis]|uniref:Uncharacterized protein n=1 Tax=Podospora australis TaxID=1536484 RepID=A0AAN6WW47_9PEZI|nr:hypothetical protein QBC35DRAFT_462050 [Podospora australis]
MADREAQAEFECPNAPCVRQLRHLRHRVEQANDTHRQDQEVIAGLREEIQRLKDENAQLRARLAGRGRHTIRASALADQRLMTHDADTLCLQEWPQKLQDFFNPDVPADNKLSWPDLHKLICKEENMSSSIKWVHPDIRFVPPPLPDLDEDGEPILPAPPQQPEVAAVNNVGEQPQQPFRFEALPSSIQLEILKLELYKPGQLVHCVSRLDPFIPPAAPQPLRNFFVFGRENVNITHGGDNPREVLRLLQVSKRFYFLGVHVFYGMNTFAFSSLGEFHRFCQGSTLKRVGRIQHLELVFTGNQYLTAPLDERRRVPFSRRTYALSWLADMPRIKTFVIHIDESSKSSMSRKDENPRLIEFMAGKTAGQPNHRKTRALRCCQGIDFIYMLRGLNWIRFYDLNKAVKTADRPRVPIRDWSFSEDVTNTSTMPKVPSRLDGAKLENLRSLFEFRENQVGVFNPVEDDWDLVNTLFSNENGRCSYDELRRHGLNHDADAASFALSLRSDDGSDADISSQSSIRGRGRRGRRGRRGNAANRGRARLSSSYASSSSSSSSSGLFISDDEPAPPAPVIELSSDDEEDEENRLINILRNIPRSSPSQSNQAQNRSTASANHLNSLTPGFSQPPRTASISLEPRPKEETPEPLIMRAHHGALIDITGDGTQVYLDPGPEVDDADYEAEDEGDVQDDAGLENNMLRTPPPSSRKKRASELLEEDEEDYEDDGKRQRLQ